MRVIIDTDEGQGPPSPVSEPFTTPAYIPPPTQEHHPEPVTMTPSNSDGKRQEGKNDGNSGKLQLFSFFKQIPHFSHKS